MILKTKIGTMDILIILNSEHKSVNRSFWPVLYVHFSVSLKIFAYRPHVKSKTLFYNWISIDQKKNWIIILIYLLHWILKCNSTFFGVYMVMPKYLKKLYMNNSQIHNRKIEESIFITDIMVQITTFFLGVWRFAGNG